MSQVIVLAVVLAIIAGAIILVATISYLMNKDKDDS